MARILDDLGHLGRATKPIALRTYEPGSLPDPAQCVDGLILVNDRSDGIPRKRLHLSNGASWDALAFELDVPRASVGNASTPVDLTPIVRQAVADALPALLPPPMRVVTPAPQPQAALPNDGMRQVLDIVSALTDRVAELEERIAFNERIAASTDIEVRAQ